MHYWLNTISLLFIIVYFMCDSCLCPTRNITSIGNDIARFSSDVSHSNQYPERTPVEDEGEIIDAYNERQPVADKKRKSYSAFCKKRIIFFKASFW